ncbi:MAG TPA: 6-phosphofructokinase, partial [bacterium]|nr:6-phosphofructokinase [bacterium]
MEVSKVKGLTDSERELFRYDLEIKKLGRQDFVSPLTQSKRIYSTQVIPENERIMAFIDKSVVDSIKEVNIDGPSFEKAGPREKLFFEPGETVSAVVTCGGICPGLNAVIRGIVVMNYYRYNNQRILGISNGYAGLVKEYGYE